MTNDEEHIPKSIREVLHVPELNNIRNRNGWAKGNVTLFEGDETRREHEGVIIELFNGEGTAGEFGGVKFMAATDGGLIENYAFATKDAYVHSDQATGWVVTEWTDPEDPDYGEPAP